MTASTSSGRSSSATTGTARGPAHRAVREQHTASALSSASTTHGHQAPRPNSTGTKGGTSRTPGGGAWHQALMPYTLHPETFDPTTEVFAYSDATVTIYDQFPKSSVHMLVMPRRALANISAVDPSKPEDMQLVEEVDGECRRVMALMQAKHPTLRFRTGLHAVPSMTQLHVHLISQDFQQAEKLKTKQHWNSFITPFFIEWDWVVGEIKAGRNVAFDKTQYEPLLKSPLKCHECTHLPAFSTMPQLKAHLDAHPHGRVVTPPRPS